MKQDNQTVTRDTTWNCPYCKKDYNNMDITSLIIHTNGNCLPKGDKRK